MQNKETPEFCNSDMYKIQVLFVWSENLPDIYYF